MKKKIGVVFILTLFLMIIWSAVVYAGNCPTCGSIGTANLEYQKIDDTRCGIQWICSKFPNLHKWWESEENHSYGDLDWAPNGEEWQGHCFRPKCVRCGATSNNWSDHTWGVWTSISETQHQRICQANNYHTQTASHADTNGDGACDACGYQMHVHTWPANYTQTPTQHYKDCPVCGVRLEIGNHMDYDYNGYCDACWYDMRAIPTLTVNPPTLSLLNGNIGAFTYTYNGNGAVTVTSSASSICTVSPSGTTIIVTAVGVGATTVTVSAAETSSYKAASQTVTVNVSPSYYRNNANVYFATLADAFNGTASGGTITVLRNVTDESNATLAEGKTITLNTDGKTITKTAYGIANYGRNVNNKWNRCNY